MEPKRDSSLPGVATVILWFLSSFLAAAASAPPTDALPGCRRTCGDVEIPYPFGIGPNCSLTGFELSCNDTTRKPFLFNVEVLSISLSIGQARINNEISWQCYNITSRNTSSSEWYLNFMSTPYRFSNNLNTFTAIGCDTLAYMTAANSKDDYGNGCISVCDNKASLTNDSSCSGIGCCQTAIPKGINYYDVSFDKRFNSSDVWNFSRCSYAVLVETARFKFNTSYITTDALQEIEEVPLVLDWAIGNETCQKARQNKNSYACVSNNSVCVDSLNGPGYLCNCSMGYQGNPYLPQGCQGRKMPRSRKLKNVTIVELISQTNEQGGGEDGISNFEKDGEAATRILARQLIWLRQQILNLQGIRAQIRGVATHTQHFNFCWNEGCKQSNGGNEQANGTS